MNPVVAAVLVAWGVVALPAGVLIGRAIADADRRRKAQPGVQSVPEPIASVSLLQPRAERGRP